MPRSTSAASVLPELSVLARLPRRLRRRFLGRCRAAGEVDGFAIAVERLRADALDVAEIVDALEWAVRVAVGDDGLGLAEADAVERRRDGLRVGLVDRS